VVFNTGIDRLPEGPSRLTTVSPWASCPEPASSNQSSAVAWMALSAQVARNAALHALL
jgi:hypothetical protein